MSVTYRAVQWSGHKLRYDLAIAGAVALYLGGFVAVGSLRWNGDHAISPPILAMRAAGTCAIFLLYVILSIGPLARLDRRFLPLLYNRRHLGVVTFLLGLMHAVLAVGFYHGFGSVSPFVSLFTSSTQFGSISAFPFELLGLAGLLVLFLMAATSHDFWLKNLTPAVWKALHMLVYPAWMLLVLHAALGTLQSERNIVYPALLGAGVIIVSCLHLLAGRLDRKQAVSATPITQENWIDVCAVSEIRENRARVVCLQDRERIAIFRHGGRFSALSNVCVHQGGPLGEGKIVNGCVTCPWHGYQYRPEDGQSPPPFKEKISTYRVRVKDGRVLIDPNPLPPGTATEPALIETSRDHQGAECSNAIDVPVQYAGGRVASSVTGEFPNEVTHV